MVFVPGSRFKEDRCTGCGICSSICPVCAIVTDPEGRPAGFSGLCIGCGHCGIYCPENCFGLEPLAAEDVPPPKQMDELFRGRRSVRKFREQDLTPEQINELLEPLNWTPTGHNDQGITVRVLQDRASVDKLIVKRFSRILKVADCFRILSLAGGAFVRRMRAGEDLLAWGAPCVLLFRSSLRSATPVQDSLIAASAVAMKAESMGLGTLWSGFIRIVAPLAGLGTCHAVLCTGVPLLKPHQAFPPRRWKRVDLQGRQGS